MTTLYMVRHGPTHAKTLLGWTDRPADLSDTAAIARLEGFLPQEAIVISSDLIRASATADAILGTRQRLSHSAALREMHFGDWEEQHYSEIEDQDRLRLFWEHPGDVRPPSGESWHELCARVNKCIDTLAEIYAGQPLVVVAHFGVILSQIQRAEGITPEAVLAHKIDNLSVTEVHQDGPGWRMGRINHIP